MRDDRYDGRNFRPRKQTPEERERRFAFDAGVAATELFTDLRGAVSSTGCSKVVEIDGEKYEITVSHVAAATA